MAVVKRMFSDQILDSDAFSDMPTDAQMLYIRLNMAADDRGIVSNPRKVMRAYNFSDDCMKILASKKFVLIRSREDDGCTVVIIKHWRMHNTIKNDRFKESPFVDFLDGVYYDENKAYSLTPGDKKTPVLLAKKPAGAALEPSWNQDGSSLVPQYSTVQDSTVQSRLDQYSTGESNNNPSFLAESEKSEAEEVPDYITRSAEYYRSHNLPEPDWLVRAKAFHPEGGGI